MHNTTYLDFDLLIERGLRTDDAVRDVYRARVLNSPVGQAVGAFKLPFSDSELSSFFQLLISGRMNGPLSAQSFGNQLFEALFEDAVGNSLLRSLDAAEREGKGLRIRLRLNDVPELATLPWEYLRSPTDERFLVLSGQTPIVRYLELAAAAEQPLELVRPLRILTVIANPINFPPLDVENERKKMQDALGELQDRGLIELHHLPEATLAQLQEHLRKNEYHILHFVGHGAFDNSSKCGGLIFLDEKKKGHFVSAPDLSPLLRDHRSLRLLLLNACEGARANENNPFAGTAQRLVQQGLPSVIAMQFPVSDNAAITLTHEFYQALADGYPVDAALGEARKAIFTRGNKLEWGTPVLFMRAPDGKLFDIEGVGEDAPAPGVPPFKGLHYFEEKDAPRFFGREKLTGQLVAKLRDTRFQAVIGASGSGKSSLVRAGVLPALRRGEALDDLHGTLPPEGSQFWPVHIITPTADPLESLAASLTASESVMATETLINDLKDTPRALHLHVRKMLSQQQHSVGQAQNGHAMTAHPAYQNGSAHNLVPTFPLAPHQDDFFPANGSALTQAQSRTFAQPSRRLLLVVDQFEELFTLCRSAQERQAFIDNLMHAVTRDGPTVVVITLRADFYAECAHFEQLRFILGKQQLFIGPMNEDELRRAIEEPARRGNWQFETGLVDKLLKDVGREPGALPLLSHALLETWKRRRARMLTLTGYIASEGIQGAIAKTAEQVFNQRLTKEQQKIARQIFLQLTELGEGAQDTRRRVALKELVPNRQTKKMLAVEGVLQTLSHARLVTISADNAQVAHEALIRNWPTLHTWLNEDRQALRLHRQLSADAREWLKLKRDSGALYRGARLEQTIEWATTHMDELNSQERRFLGASKELAEQERLEEQERQQKELEQARALATQEVRARERITHFTMWLSVLFFVALMLAGFASYQANEALEAKEQAEKAEINAQENEKEALEAKKQAEQAKINAQEKENEALKAKEIAEAERKNAEAERKNAEAERKNAEAERKNAQIQSRISLAKSLTGQVPYIIESRNDTGLATLLSMEALYLNDKLKGDAQELISYSLLDALSQPNFNIISANHEAIISSVAFTPDGQMLVSATEKGYLHFWDLSKPHLSVKKLKAHRTGTTRIAFSPDGRLVSAGSDGQIRLWDVTTPTPTSQLLAWDLAAVKSVAFSAQAQAQAQGGAPLLAASTKKGTIYIWDLSRVNADPLVISAHEGEALSVAFTPDGKTLASTGADKTVQLWDLSPVLSDRSAVISPTATLSKHNKKFVSMVISPDGQWLAAAGEDNKIWVYDLSNLNAEPIQLAAHTNWISALAFSPDGKRLASASWDLTSRVWDFSKGAKKATSIPLRGHADTVLSVAFTPDGQQLASGSRDWVLRLWNLAQENQAGPSKMRSAAPTILNHGHQRVWSVEFSSDRQHMATGSGNGQIRLWKTQVITSPNLTPTILSGHKQTVYSVAFSPNGKILASASVDKSIRLWDVNKPNTLIAILTGHKAAVHSVAFSPDGKKLVSASADKSIRLWHLNDATAEPTILGYHDDLALSVAFSPNGDLVASASEDGSIYLWDLTHPDSKPKALTRHNKFVDTVTFSPDGQFLASASGDYTVRLWHVTSPDPNQSVIELKGHTSKVRSVAFSPDSKTLVSAGDDKTIRLWDVTNPDDNPFVLIGHTDWVRSLAFTPDGETLASSSDDGSVRLWIASMDSLTDLACQLVRRNLSWNEWQRHLASEPYRRTCPHFPPSPSAIEALIKESQQLARNGDIEAAIAKLDHVLALKPNRELVLRVDPDFNFNTNAERNAERYAQSKP